MRVMLRTAVLFVLSASVFPRQVPAEPSGVVWVNRLVIDSKTLSESDRESLSRSFVHRNYPILELQTRIQLAVRDLGYFLAIVDQPSVAALSTHAVDIEVAVNAGERYCLGEIRFEGGSIFSRNELRNAFAIGMGEPFAPTRIGQGLERLRQQYGSEGYLDFIAAPALESYQAIHVVDLVIQLEEGSQFILQDLNLDGVEPRPGAGQALLRSWAGLRGKRFDSKLLDQWLEVNHLNCPGCTERSNITTFDLDPERKTVNIRLTLPALHDAKSTVLAQVH